MRSFRLTESRTLMTRSRPFWMFSEVGFCKISSGQLLPAGGVFEQLLEVLFRPAFGAYHRKPGNHPAQNGGGNEPRNP